MNIYKIINIIQHKSQQSKLCVNCYFHGLATILKYTNPHRFIVSNIISLNSASNVDGTAVAMVF